MEKKKKKKKKVYGGTKFLFSEEIRDWVREEGSKSFKDTTGFFYPTPIYKEICGILKDGHLVGKVKFLSIIGTPGVGKTTAIKKAFAECQVPLLYFQATDFGDYEKFFFGKNCFGNSEAIPHLELKQKVFDFLSKKFFPSRISDVVPQLSQLETKTAEELLGHELLQKNICGIKLGICVDESQEWAVPMGFCFATNGSKGDDVFKNVVAKKDIQYYLLHFLFLYVRDKLGSALFVLAGTDLCSQVSIEVGSQTKPMELNYKLCSSFGSVASAKKSIGTIITDEELVNTLSEKLHGNFRNLERFLFHLQSFTDLARVKELSSEDVEKCLVWAQEQFFDRIISRFESNGGDLDTCCNVLLLLFFQPELFRGCVVEREDVRYVSMTTKDFIEKWYHLVNYGIVVIERIGGDTWIRIPYPFLFALMKRKSTVYNYWFPQIQSEVNELAVRVVGSDKGKIFEFMIALEVSNPTSSLRKYICDGFDLKATKEFFKIREIKRNTVIPEKKGISFCIDDAHFTGKNDSNYCLSTHMCDVNVFFDQVKSMETIRVAIECKNRSTNTYYEKIENQLELLNLESNGKVVFVLLSYERITGVLLKKILELQKTYGMEKFLFFDDFQESTDYILPFSEILEAKHNIEETQELISWLGEFPYLACSCMGIRKKLVGTKRKRKYRKEGVEENEEQKPVEGEGGSKGVYGTVRKLDAGEEDGDGMVDEGDERKKIEDDIRSSLRRIEKIEERIDKKEERIDKKDDRIVEINVELGGKLDEDRRQELKEEREELKEDKKKLEKKLEKLEKKLEKLEKKLEVERGALKGKKQFE